MVWGSVWVVWERVWDGVWDMGQLKVQPALLSGCQPGKGVAFLVGLLSAGCDMGSGFGVFLGFSGFSGLVFDESCAFLGSFECEPVLEGASGVFERGGVIAFELVGGDFAV